VKWAVGVLVALNVLLLIVVAAQLTLGGSASDEVSITYAEFLSISLTAITVLLALVALTIAGASFIGRAQLMEAARKAAATKADEIIREEFRQIVRSRLPVDQDIAETPESIEDAREIDDRDIT
jgi:hypothetical protein